MDVAEPVFATVARYLMRTAVGSDAKEQLEDVRRLLPGLRPAAMCALMTELGVHLLLPQAYQQFHTDGVLCLLPETIQQQLAAARTGAYINAGVRARALSRVVMEFRKCGIDPVLMKGMALANTVYPIFGARQMVDVDLWVTSGDLSEPDRILADLGYLLKDDLADGHVFDGPGNVRLDVHRRLRIFDQFEPAILVTKVSPPHLSLDEVSVFSPPVTLSHVAYHMAAHWPKTGLQARWVLDYAMLIAYHKRDLKPEEVLRFTPAESRGWVSGLARFVAEELGLDPHPGLLDIDADGPKITLQEIARSRRRALWGIPKWRGWLRLGAAVTGVRPRPTWPRPRLADFVP
ncbi:MAG: nucleotidyltransferase family protein [Planctomycetota bacterium]